MEVQVSQPGQESEVVQAKISVASPHTQRRAMSRSRARARRRSLSLLPSYRAVYAGDEANEGLVSKDMEPQRRKKEDSQGVDEEIEEFTYPFPPEEEHIWLLPKAARRAQKKEQRVLGNASGGHLLKNKIPSF
ncbi:unnamed protein product, partial [Brassica oleracea]